MPDKAWQTQWTETVNYLNQNFATDRLGDHIQGVVDIGLRPAITEEISLGPLGAGTENKRHALRGLLLCQRVYYSPLWAKSTWDRTQYIDDTWSLVADWRQKSLTFWGSKSEQNILAGLSIFVPVLGASRQDLVDAAKEGPPTGEGLLYGNLFLSRPVAKVPGPAETCYRGVLAWLLKSGLVSMRWLMKDTMPNGEIGCNRLFGTGEEVWSANRPFYPTNVLPTIGPGYIVHMWKDETGTGGWNGHWVVSNGDGTICGVNNGIVKKKDEVVIQKYTNRGKLRSQFEGYGGILTMERFNPDKPQKAPTMEPLYPGPFSQNQYAHAHLVKFDPLALPNLL